MSKAILVMDMPESCMTCQLRKFSFERNPMCAGNVKAIPYEDYFFGQKADFCPLKPLPDSVPASSTDDERYVKGFEAGWNMCLNEIGG